MTRQRLRPWIGALLLLFLAASAIYGGGFFGVRDRFAPPATTTRASPFVAVDGEGEARTASYRRSLPYWRPLTRFEGSGSERTPAFAVRDQAIQWRVNWRCERAPFRIQPQRSPGEDFGHRLADADDCPEEGTGVSVAHGRFSLEVESQGPWEAGIEEQVDVPLIEPPTAEMRSGGRLLASGRFHDIDEDGEGSVRIYRNRDGSAGVRLEDFFVTPNVDLEIRLSELERPRTTEQVAEAPFEDVVFLRATSGEMNYRIPPGVFTDRIRSVVIWCEITHNAYAAAPLRR